MEFLLSESQLSAYKNAASYSRKSSEPEDGQVTSVPQQEDWIGEAAQRNGHTIPKKRRYSEAKSAKEPYVRAEYERLLVDAEKGLVDVVYGWRLNRFGRNFIDMSRLQWLLQTGKIKAIITSDRTYLPGDSALMMAVEMGMATQYSRDLGRDVTRGMLNKVKLGWRPGPPALGYKSDPGGLRGQRVIFKDEETFELVNRCWELLLSEKYTVPKIYDIATKQWGLTKPCGRRKRQEGIQNRPLSLSGLYSIFKNPFFCGLCPYKGKVYPGKHEAMITKAQFDLAQEIIGRKGKPRPKVYHNTYAGVIHCGACNGMIVMELKRKILRTTNETKEYRFYRCSRYKKRRACTQTCRVTHDDLEKQLAKIAYEVELPSWLVEWSLEKLKGSQDDMKGQQQRELLTLQTRHQTILQKRSTLVDLQLDPATRIPDDLYQEKLSSLAKEAEDMQSLIADFEAHAQQWSFDIVDAVKFTEQMQQKYDTGSAEERLDILIRLGQRIELKDGIVTCKLKEPFETLTTGRKDIEQKFGRVGPLKDGFGKAQAGAREDALLEWWAILDSNQ